MTNKLKKLINVVGRDFYLQQGSFSLLVVDEKGNEHFKNKPFKVTESSHCEALMSALRVCVDVIEMQQKAMRASIARSDDYGDSHCSAPIREAIKQATDKLMESIE